MAIQITCEACGKRLKAPDAAAGRNTRCPSCGGPLSVPDPEPDRPVEDRSAGAPSPAAEPEGWRTNPASIAALASGILALSICWVPSWGPLAELLGGLGVLLGACGI